MIGFRTGTSRYKGGTFTRWYLENPDTDGAHPVLHYETCRDRDAATAQLLGGAEWPMYQIYKSPLSLGVVGSGWDSYNRETSDNSADLIRKVVESVNVDLHKRLDDLWDALFEEAKKRDWCEDFERFAKKHGAPERFFKPPIEVPTGIGAVIGVKNSRVRLVRVHGKKYGEVWIQNLNAEEKTWYDDRAVSALLNNASVNYEVLSEGV